MKKQPELTAQTRDNLAEAFWQIYCKTRLEKITVKQITMKAGYNRSTFYQYFTGVYDVLDHIENSVLPGSHDFPHLDQMPASGPPITIDAIARMFEKNRKYYVVLFGDNGDPSFQSKFKNYMKTMVKKHLDAGGIAATFEIELTLEFMISAMIGVLTYWFRLKDPPPTEQLFLLVGNLMHNGINSVFGMRSDGKPGVGIKHPF